MSALLALLAAAWALSGCTALSQIPEVDLVPAPRTLEIAPVQPAAGAPLNGSLFNAASFRPGFEDHRARLVGDVLNIQISERLRANQESSTTVNRNSEISAGVSALPFTGARMLGRLDTGAETENRFNGDGSTEASNTFTGSIVAVVTQVLPNGHLIVVGEKQIGVNQNVDVLQFSGTVDPRTIRPGNTVQSTQVANVRVLSRGRGAQADAHTFGWLSRFFLTLMPF
ncbi:MAG: flagellar L-ring protein FlgH [Comamonadaceae bacterium BICA1-1]|nr:MAG: flagellar L-ring protein FlgH [Comamonadaceae bacterium BICA1-1]